MNAGKIVKCTHCDKMIDPDSTSTYRRVEGWDRPRLAGGTNAVALRHSLNEYSCEPCIKKLKDGIDPAQMNLA